MLSSRTAALTKASMTSKTGLPTKDQVCEPMGRTFLIPTTTQLLSAKETTFATGTTSQTESYILPTMTLLYS